MAEPGGISKPFSLNIQQETDIHSPFANHGDLRGRPLGTNIPNDLGDGTTLIIKRDCDMEAPKPTNRYGDRRASLKEPRGRGAGAGTRGRRIPHEGIYCAMDQTNTYIY